MTSREGSSQLPQMLSHGTSEVQLQTAVEARGFYQSRKFFHSGDQENEKIYRSEKKNWGLVAL